MTNRTKYDPTSQKLVFVGYDNSTKGYKLWNPSSKRTVISTDVVFEETVFPLKSTPKLPLNPPTPAPPLPSQTSPPSAEINLALPESDDEDEHPLPPVPSGTPGQPPTAPPASPPHNIPGAVSALPDALPAQAPSASTPPIALIRRSRRIQQRVVAPQPDNASPDAYHTHRAGPSILHDAPSASTVWDDSIVSYLASAQTTPAGDPTTYEYAISCLDADKWRPAMGEEIKSLLKNDTWELCDLPQSRKAIKCKWVYLTKHDTAGHVTRYRARLVAKGFSQTAGIDYDETFAPVARLDSLRLLLALAARLDWDIHHVDIKSAYLNGDLDEEIYMDQPKGFTIQGMEGKVCHLKKAIYGLKQAGRQWHAHLNNTLEGLGFQKLISGDASIFIKRHDGGDPLIALVYVDDIALFGILDAIRDLKRAIATHYKVTDLGEIRQFLGLHITRDRSKKTLTISQSHYIERMLTRFNMSSCQPNYTPFAKGTLLVANIEKDSDASLTSRYQQIVGSLMYAMLGSQPDICFAVNRLSQFGSKPTQEHLYAAQHVLRYLSATRNIALTYGSNDSTELIGYSDSDWASDTNDRRSTTGYTFILAGGAIAWATQKQRTVALSTTEAEYMALCECAKHAQWSLSLLKQLDFIVDLPLKVFCDSSGAKDIAANNVFHKRTKHIDIRYHYTRELINKQIINILPVSSTENIADLLTKSLSHDQHHFLAKKFGLIGSSSMGECCKIGDT